MAILVMVVSIVTPMLSRFFGGRKVDFGSQTIYVLDTLWPEPRGIGRRADDTVG